MLSVDMKYLEDLPPVMEKLICDLNRSALPIRTYYPTRISFTYISASVVSSSVKTFNGVLEHKP